MSRLDFEAGREIGFREGYRYGTCWYVVLRNTLVFLAVVALSWAPVIFVLRWAWTRWA